MKYLKIRLKILLAAIICGVMQAVAFDADIFNAFYLIGGAVPGVGWSRETAPQLEEKLPGVYFWTGELQEGDFKLLVSYNAWSAVVATEYNCPVTVGMPMAADMYYEDGTGAVDHKWYVNRPGNYSVIFDKNDMTLTVNQFDASTAQPYEGVAYGDSSHKVCETLTHGRYVIKATDAEGRERYLYVADDGTYGYVDTPSEATQLQVNASSEHKQVLIDTDNKRLTVKTFTPLTKMYVVGSFTDWSFVPMAHEAADPMTFTWTGDIAVGNGTEVKFKADDRFVAGEDIWAYHPVVNNQPLHEADHVVAGGLDDNKWAVTQPGNYTLKINPFKLTASAIRNDDTPTDVMIQHVEVASNSDVRYYNLQGMPVERTAPHTVYIERRGAVAKKVIFSN